MAVFVSLTCSPSSLGMKVALAENYQISTETTKTNTWIPSHICMCFLYDAKVSFISIPTTSAKEEQMKEALQNTESILPICNSNLNAETSQTAVWSKLPILLKC